MTYHADLPLLHLQRTSDFGAAYLEAWNFGKRVAGCEILAVSEVISSGVDGCLAEQKSSSIAEAVIGLLLDPERARAMGRAGQQKVQGDSVGQLISGWIS